MVEEETLDDDTLRDQVERGDSDGLAAHQSIDDERPGFAENAGYGCAGFACDPVNAERHAGVADRRPNFVSPHPFISDDARQRGPDRIYTLDEIQVIHVDRRVLDTDQHLAGGRCWRFGKVGKLKDDARLAESSDLHCTHSVPPVLVMAEFDEVA